MIEELFDISFWQGNVDKEEMLAVARGLIIRLGSINKDTGACYEDYLFRENNAKFDHEIPCGYYFYFRPKFSGLLQAQFVANLLLELEIPLRLPMVIDVEDNSTGLSQSKIQYEVLAFLQHLKSVGFTNLAIYTRGSFWNTNVGNPVWAKNYKLWVAMYSDTATHPWNGYPEYYHPESWDDYWMWQWSQTYDGKPLGCEGALDANRCNVSEDEWDNYIGYFEEPSSFLCTIGNLLVELGTALKEKC